MDSAHLHSIWLNIYDISSHCNCIEPLRVGSAKCILIMWMSKWGLWFDFLMRLGIGGCH